MNNSNERLSVKVSPEPLFYISGIITQIITLDNFNQKDSKYIDQPNSDYRKCYTIPSSLKEQILELITSDNFKNNIQILYDSSFSNFSTIIGFITSNVEATNQTHVSIHRDKSDYTINIFLNDDFNGGELVLCGKTDVNYNFKKLAKKINETDELIVLPEKNKMIIHRGKHLHYVKKINNGCRYNLILWCYERNLNQSNLISEEFIIL